MDIELLQTPAGNSSNRNTKKKKKRRAKKKAMEENGLLIMDQMDGNLEVSDNIRDCKLVNNVMEKNLPETDLTVESLAECPEGAAGSTENLSEMNSNSKKKKIRKKIKKKKSKIQDEIQIVDQTKMDTGSTENLAEKNVNHKRKRRGKKKKAKNKDEILSMDEVDGMLNLHLSDGNHGEEIDGKHTKKEITSEVSGIEITSEVSGIEITSEVSEISVRKESSLSDLMHDKVNPLDLYKDEEAGFSARQESSLSDLIHEKGNPLDLCKESVSIPVVLEVSSNRVSSEIFEERSEHLPRPMEMDEKCIPCYSQLGTHPNQMAAQNLKADNRLNKVNDELLVDSTCNVEVTQHLSSSGVNEAECLPEHLLQYPRMAQIPLVKRKLIVLDVNGLLANIVMPAPKDCRGDVHLLGRAIFRRPFCDDFLKFCFQNFDVGVWSSRSKKIIDRVVEYLLGDLKDELLFCWDMSHSTQTGFNTLENIHKPLVFKELRKIWENDDPNLPWKNGDYNESNTLLLDDSPYKALLNPLHTAIFPNSYNYKDKNDKSLGPGGDLRVYLEGLLTSEDVQKHVEQNPFGQSAINETNLSWGFYSGVLQTMSNRLEYSAPSSQPTLS